MTIDYRIRCPQCGHSWDILGDGCFANSINSHVVRCEKCNCQKLNVLDCDHPNKGHVLIDFTEQNKALASTSKTQSIPIEQLRFKATNKNTGESCIFTFDDLYGYEGEVCGILLKTNSWVLSYNSGCGMDGLNPDLEIVMMRRDTSV